MSDYDLVVIGGGFAGTAAALSFLETAKEAGRDGRVALIEAGDPGRWPGASRWARPFLRLDPDNRLPRDFIDQVEEASGGKADLDYCRKLVDEVPDTVEFMQDHGVKLRHHDEEDAALDFEDQHFVFLTSGGKEIVDFYLDHIGRYEEADVLLGHEATQLTTDEGQVNGVVVRAPGGEELTITGDKVLLASGSFGGNREMLKEHLGKDADDLPNIAPGIRYNQGAGIRMAMEVGADTAGQFDMFHAELVDPRARKYHAAFWGQNYGIVVNEDCERFHDEGEDYLFATAEVIAYETWRDQNQKSYFITDKTVMERFEGSWIHDQNNQPPEQSDTIAGLAEKLGLDPQKLEATVEEFNAACGPGDWDPSRMDGKKTSEITPPKSNWANPITEAPFYGFPMTAHIMFTYGGLKVDSDGRVMSTDGEPIPGLYAAGEITGLFYQKMPPGTLVLRANTFGRIIGENVAESLPDRSPATN